MCIGSLVFKLENDKNEISNLSSQKCLIVFQTVRFSKARRTGGRCHLRAPCAAGASEQLWL